MLPLAPHEHTTSDRQGQPEAEQSREQVATMLRTVRATLWDAMAGAAAWLRPYMDTVIKQLDDLRLELVHGLPADNVRAMKNGQWSKVTIGLIGEKGFEYEVAPEAQDEAEALYFVLQRMLQQHVTLEMAKTVCHQFIEEHHLHVHEPAQTDLDSTAWKVFASDDVQEELPMVHPWDFKVVEYRDHSVEVDFAEKQNAA